MKNNKKKINRGAATAMSVCMGLGTFLQMPPTVINAYELSDVKESNKVFLQKKENVYTFGNKYITRSFNVENNKLYTTNITNYRTGANNTVFTPQAGSEEFVINTLNNGFDKEAEMVKPLNKLQNDGWTVSSDSISTGEGQNGHAEKMFDGKDNTYYHSKYESGVKEDELKYPHNIYVDLKSEKNIKSVRYQQRLDEYGQPTVSGHVKTFKIYTADSIENLKTQTKPKFEGKFDDAKETYVNLDGDGITAQYVRIEFTEGYPPSSSGVNANVACCSEFEFFEDKAVFPEKPVSQIKSSDLTLKGNPIEKNIDGGKSLTFNFNPITFRGVEYTISEVITMKDNDSFMRKHLEISVPEDQADKAIIDYIDLENMNIHQDDLKKDEYWTIPEQKNNNWMAGMKGDYLELGQPYYLDAMYFGCEFPQTENKIREGNGFIRYHYGKSLAKDKHFEYNKNNTAGKMTTWDAVVGAARSKDYNVVQSDFYEYIETIATKTDFRQQYNSWFDHMKDISADNIQKSFYEVEKGLTQHGVKPLDSYVVDDGWVNYSSFWDFNSKFPNQLYDSSLQVNQLGSNFGLWLGPRGGYGTEGQIAGWIEQNNLGSRNPQSGNDINISDARYTNKLLNDVFLKYQNNFDINYWKLDGMLLNPATQKSEYYVTGKPEYTITETYERWTDMYEKMREQRNGKDLWINMTSYVNPSPWYLQWVNSVWMQNTADVDFTKKFDSTDEQQMLTYRDNSYFEFVNERQWQLPFKYFYNHDPVYGNRTHEGKNRNPIKFEDNELREYLYMLGTRGTAFWEYYYSYNMFDDDKWDVNSEAANWIEDNFHILQKSKMFGGKPDNGDVYGYSCWNGNEGIVSLRNPSDVEKTYTITYDRLIGVGEGIKDLYGKVVIGDIDRQNNDKLSYGDKITYTLKPKETLIMQYGTQDVKSATIDSIHADGNKVEVEFNETIRTPEKENISIEGHNVTNVLLKEDRRTVEVTVENEIEDASDIKVSVDGIKDTVGNITKTSAVDDHYKDDVVTNIVSRELDGKAINKGNVYAIDGKEGFSITGKITTESKNAEIVRQEGSYVLSIDKDGYLNFSLNDVSVNSKYTEKTIKSGQVNSEVKGKIADGKEHQFTAVKEVNGMLKLYIDGHLVASEFNEEKMNPSINKGDVVFADGLVGKADYVTVVDHAMAYDEVSNFVLEYGNVVASKNNANVKISAYDVTEKKALESKGDRPFSCLNDGNKDTNNYLELPDTSNGKNHSRYVQVDLGAEYELDKLHLTRYYSDSRTYGPTVISLSDNENFEKPTIVYNSDTTGEVHNLGKGTDKPYVETAEGKDLRLESSVKARYIRVYVNGRQGSTSDHLVELEAYGKRVETSSSVSSVYYRALEDMLKEDLGKIYTKSSVDKYKNVAKETIKKAEELVEKKNAKSDADVEELINELKEHRNQLEKRADVAEAQALIEDLNSQNLKEKDYTKDTWSAYSKAKSNLEKAVADTSDISEKYMKSLIDALKQARTNLVTEKPVEPEKPIVNKEKLEIAVEVASKVTDEELDLVVPVVATEFRAALEEAIAILNNDKATQSEVNESWERLSKAMQMLSFYKGDKTELIALVDKIGKLNSSEYIPSTWNKLQCILEEINVVVNDPNALEKEVSEAYNKLMRGYLELRLKPNKDKLGDLINRADALDPNKYTSDSFKVVEDALAVAKDVFDNEEATEEEVEMAEINLMTALDGLVENKEDNAEQGTDQDNDKNDEEDENNNSDSDKENVGNNTNNNPPKTGMGSGALFGAFGSLAAMVGAVFYRRKKD